MSTRTTIHNALTTLAATAMLASAVGAASARNLSTSNQNIRATWRSLEFRSPIVTIRCPLTLEGSFHARTIAKVARTLIGAITRAMINQGACTNGRFIAFNGTEAYGGGTAPQTLPWHLTYESFEGTLPNITSIIILLSRFRFGMEAGGCRAQYGSETDNISARANRDVAARTITSITPIAGRDTMTKIREDADPLNVCPASLNGLGGSTSVTLLNSSALLTITLI